MAWPNSPATPSAYDQGTDDPSLARSQILDLHTKLSSVIANRGQSNGVCDLDSSGKIPLARYGDIPYGLGRYNDLRGSETDAPSALFGKGTRFGFVSGTSLGIPGASGSYYGTLINNGQWSDGSGGAATNQIFIGPDSRAWMRARASDTTWTVWRELLTPLSLATSSEVSVVTVNGMAVDGTIMGPGAGQNAVCAYHGIDVPAGKRLYLRRARGAGQSANLRWAVNHSIAYFGSGSGGFDEDVNVVIADNSGGGSVMHATQTFSIQYVYVSGSNVTIDGAYMAECHFLVDD